MFVYTFTLFKCKGVKMFLYMIKKLSQDKKIFIGCFVFVFYFLLRDNFLLFFDVGVVYSSFTNSKYRASKLARTMAGRSLVLTRLFPSALTV